MKVQIQYEDGTKRTIGVIERKILYEFTTVEIFYKTITSRKALHLFEKLNAFGIDAKSFKEIIVPKCDVIMIKDKYNDILYATTPNIYNRLGEYLTFPPHKSQIFLSLVHFKQYKDGVRIEDSSPLTRTLDFKLLTKLDEKYGKRKAVS